MSWIAKSIGLLGLTFSWVLVHSPRFVRSAIGGFLGLLWYDVFRIRRKVVADNLNIAFPDLSRSEKVKIGRRSLINLGTNLVEYCYLPFLNRGNYSEIFDMQGTELLDQAEKEGRGALLLTLHLGNGDLSAVSLAFRGYK